MNGIIGNMMVSLGVVKFRMLYCKAKEKIYLKYKNTFGALDQMYGYNSRCE